MENANAIASEVSLGFGKSPRRRSVYVNRSKEDCLWYFWNGATEKHEPIEASDLYCVLEGLEIRESGFKNKLVEKLNLLVQGDELYRLVAGIDTAFAQSVVSALSFYAFDFARPISIVVKAGESEGVVFGSVYQRGVTASEATPRFESTDDVRKAIEIINERLRPAVVESEKKVDFSEDPRPTKAALSPPKKLITPAQVKRLWAIAKEQEWTSEMVDLLLADRKCWDADGEPSSKSVPVADYDSLIASFSNSELRSQYREIAHPSAAVGTEVVQDEIPF